MDLPQSPFRSLVVSIVSHGHGAPVEQLLHTLAQRSAGTLARVVLTLNLPEAMPESPPGGWPFALEIVHNARPLGFGANHNQALAGALEPFVCVLNPDVQLLGGGAEPLDALVQAAACQGVGCAYPVQIDATGQVQDSERALPTPQALWRRRVLHQSDRRVDWVNAACLVLPGPVWRGLGGFDDAYFMYCEDVDLSLRIRLAGLSLVRVPVQVLHAGERASHRRWSHLQWHVRSLVRLWCSPVYRQARQMLPAMRQGADNIGAP